MVMWGVFLAKASKQCHVQRQKAVCAHRIANKRPCQRLVAHHFELIWLEAEQLKSFLARNTAHDRSSAILQVQEVSLVICQLQAKDNPRHGCDGGNDILPGPSVTILEQITWSFLSEATLQGVVRVNVLTSGSRCCDWPHAMAKPKDLCCSLAQTSVTLTLR